MISDELSIKKFGVIELLWGILAESLIITLSFYSSSSLWLYLPNLLAGSAELFYLFSHCLSIVTFLKHKHDEPRFIQGTHRILQLIFYLASWANLLKACRSAYSLYLEVELAEGVQLLLSLVAAFIENELFKHAKVLTWHVAELRKG